MSQAIPILFNLDGPIKVNWHEETSELVLQGFLREVDPPELTEVRFVGHAAKYLLQSVGELLLDYESKSSEERPTAQKNGTRLSPLTLVSG